MRPAILRIDEALYELTQDTITSLWIWAPVIGGVPLTLCVDKQQAINFAIDRVRQLGSDRAVIIERGDEVPRGTEGGTL